MATSAKGPALRVLVVDDSAVVRQVMASLLHQYGGMEVSVASDPLIALKRIAVSAPDVVVLDIEMPHMDGLTFLERLMREHPLPVVICSSHAERGSSVSLRALRLGAIEVVAKPSIGVRDFLHDAATQLVDTVRAAASARLPGTARVMPAEPARGLARLEAHAVAPGHQAGAVRGAVVPARKHPVELVAIGASTGGVETLGCILGTLPPDCPPTVIVQHMPPGFTADLARDFDRECAASVREAKDGEPVHPGTVLVAPGGHHLTVDRRGSAFVARVSDGPLVSRHRPSVDVLFRSVAAAAGPFALGIILTGMGDDGAEGLLAMREAGAVTVAESEESCVVFGMPKAAIALDAAAHVLPLPQIPVLLHAHRLRRARATRIA